MARTTIAQHFEYRSDLRPDRAHPGRLLSLEAPGGAKADIARISSTQSRLQDEVKKFAASLSAVVS